MLDGRAGLAQRVAEVDLAAAVGREVFHQEHALTRLEMAFDLGVAAETFRLLADVLHRQHQPVGHPRCERNARGLAADDGVELLKADVAQHRRSAEVDQGLAHPRK
jgi:hypothetical protein